MSTAQDYSEKLLTRLEAAEFLRGYIQSGSKSWLASLAVRNEGPPFIVVARKALYRPDDLREWVSERFLSAKASKHSAISSNEVLASRASEDLPSTETSADEPMVADYHSINTDAIAEGLRLVAQLVV